jgi:4-aminobutyrate aminotransferase-like enzyme
MGELYERWKTCNPQISTLTRTQDVDGKEYIDFIGMFSAVNTGHCHPYIQEALIEQLKKGIPGESKVCKLPYS